MKTRFRRQVLILISLALLYVTLLQKYHPYDMDNPWFLSFSYNACHSGVLTDQFEQTRYPNGMDGVHLFGKLAAGTQCLVLDRLGWTPTGVVLLNVPFGLVSLWLWWCVLGRMGYSERWILAFIVMLGLMEPMVSTMERARYEFFAFFLLSLALWLAVDRKEFAAALISMCAVETEPGAIFVPLAILTFLALRTKSRRLLLLKAMAAAILAPAIYIALHPGAMQEIAAASRVSSYKEGYTLGGTMFLYFVERRRHLPELAMLLLGGWLYWRQRFEIPFSTPMWVAVTVGTCCIVTPHPNPAYMIFVIPFLLWPVLEAYQFAFHWRWVPSAVCLGILAQYGYIYKVNLHEGFTSQDFLRVQKQIAQAANTMHMTDEQVRIAGDYTLWFAHPVHYRALGSPNSLSDANLYLCFDGWLQPDGLSARTSLWCPELRGLTPVEELPSLELGAHRLHFFAPRQATRTILKETAAKTPSKEEKSNQR